MVKINKQRAKKLYEAGKKIMLVPCKLMYGSPWHPECVIQRGNVGYCNFTTLVNSFVYYNCSYETGYYPHYYIQEQAI